jgi:hypothetical protein
MAKSKKSVLNKNVSPLYLLVALLVGLVAVLWAFNNVSADTRGRAATGSTGNGSLPGKHYNLNIHAVTNPKDATMTDSNTHNIFILENKRCAISLGQVDTFDQIQVKDGNCTDGKAQFMLPNPDPNNTGVSAYTVFARPLGKPGRNLSMNTCAMYTYTDPVTGVTTTEELCSVKVLDLSRTRGGQKFTNVSEYLLYMYVDIYDPATGTYTPTRVPLFDPMLQDYMWQTVGNTKLVQLKFFPGVATQVSNP